MAKWISAGSPEPPGASAFGPQPARTSKPAKAQARAERRAIVMETPPKSDMASFSAASATLARRFGFEKSA
jgi:hypothetical protein